MTHIYLQFEEVNGTKVTFSVPGSPDYSHLDAKTEANEYVSPLYKIAKETNETVINFAAFDIAS